MNQRGATFRLFAALFLVVQTTGWGVAPLADAHLEAEAHAGTVHIEAEFGSDCAPGHHHAECVLCQFAGVRFIEGASARAFDTSAATTTLHAHDPAALVSAGYASLHQSRAPPLV